MKKKLSVTISFLLCLIMIFSAMPVSAYSPEEQGEALTFGHRDIDYSAPVVRVPSNNKGESSIPSSYDLRDDITIPPVRNQNPYGACWAHATTAALEIAMIKNGLADETIDLSELQLVNSSYSDSKDPLGNLTGDSSVTGDGHLLDAGGNFVCASKVLNRWNAGGDESNMKYNEDAYYVDNGGTYPDDFYYGLNRVKLSEYYVLNKENVSDIKKMIVKYGCAVTSYYHDERFVNRSTNAMFNNVNTSTNHEIAVIGWDDNYSRDNFVESRKPNNDGAWLIRNSWGEKGALNGYYWLSYEDISIDEDWGFFNVVSADEYDNNYQYDGSCSLSRIGWSGGVANVYTAASHEFIKAVNISFDYNTNASYEVRIYKNPSSEKYYVRDDVPVYKSTFSTTYAGIYTAVLDNPVEVEPGESFAVYYKIISSAEGSNYYSCAISAEWSWLNNIEAISGKSQLVYDSGYSNAYQADFRIKAFTVLADIDTPDNFTATLNSDTVSLSWKAVEGATGYEIYSSVDNKAYAPALTTAETSAELSASSSDGLLHKYKVRAVKGEEKGEFSQGRAVRFERSVRVDSLLCENETVVVGSTVNLNAVISPENASDKMISYKLISGDEYASLTNDGVLTAVKTGEAVVAAMTRDGAYSADFNVTIVGETEHDPALPVIENAVSSTCTVKGSYDSVIYCKNCGEEISRERVETELVSHTPVISKAAVEPTCSKAGSTAEYKCSVCQQVTTASQIVPATGNHTAGSAVRENEKASTCTAKGGYDNVIYCKDCGTELSREKVETELVSHTSVISKAAVEPTCSKAGSTAEYKCSVCQQVTTASQTVPATGNHTAGSAVRENEKSATCTVKGSYDNVIYCKDCGTELSREKVETELVSHTPVISKEAVEPTCSKAGSTAEYKCSVCQQVITASQTVPATGNHTAGSAVRENEKASTCTAKGSYDEVKYCTVCKSEISRKTVTLDLKAHSYAVVSSTPATCEKEGVEIRVCSVCGDTVTKNTAKTSHKDSDSNGVCDICGALTAKPCTHACHKSGFSGFIWKITNFFNKLFKINQVCECGAKHW